MLTFLDQYARVRVMEPIQRSEQTVKYIASIRVEEERRGDFPYSMEGLIGRRKRVIRSSRRLEFKQVAVKVLW